MRINQISKLIKFVGSLVYKCFLHFNNLLFINMSIDFSETFSPGIEEMVKDRFAPDLSTVTIDEDVYN